MTAAQSQTTLEDLQCHFTWDLDLSRNRLFRLWDKLEDIGTEEGNFWLGHIYNLQGYIKYKLGFTEAAQRLFNKAAEAFSQTRNTDEGPWLVVNYGNLAWLHHHLGEQEESQTYLSKVDALMEEYPSPSQDELHPEIYAEKAWTLMNFSADKKQEAADYFQRAIRMRPNRVEWNSTYYIALAKSPDNYGKRLEADIVEEMRIATEQDPENLYLAVLYLEQCAKKEKKTEYEARVLARKVLRNPVSSYSGMKTLLWLLKEYISVDEAIDLAEEALKKYPDVRYLKSCAALCYKWKIIYSGGSRPQSHMIDRAISLHEEVISLYHHSSLVKKIDLASIYAKLGQLTEETYQDLLESDLEPADKQMLYNSYANHKFFVQHDYDESTKYHMKAAVIPQQSFYRKNSIRVLKNIRDKGESRMCGEIEAILKNL